MRWGWPLGLALLLSGCLDSAGARVGLLSLLPFLLIFVGLWWLNRRRGEEQWDEEHFPDVDDDVNEDHHLM